MKKCMFLLLCSIMAIESYSQKKEILFVGTMHVRESKGIYAYEFDQENGSLKLSQAISDLDNPMFVLVHPSGKFLYSINRTSVDGVTGTGSISAFNLDPKTGNLKIINHVPSYGKRPCHLSIDKSGSFIFVSHYEEGSLSMISLNKDGSLGALADVKRYAANAESKQVSRVHSAVPSPDNKFLYVADLGFDKIYIYSMDLKNGKLVPTAKPEISLAKGAGPRHFVFHPNGSFAYLSEELTSSVASFSMDKKSNELVLMQDTVPSLPPDYTAKNASSDIQVDHAGKFLYMGNRGQDALAVYAIEKNGHIKLIGHQPAGGKVPRYIAISKKGNFVLVANPDSDNIVVFKQDPKTGLLSNTGNELKIPSPVCLQFYSLE